MGNYPGLPQWARRVIERRAEFLLAKIAVAEDPQTPGVATGKLENWKRERAALLLVAKSFEAHREAADKLLKSTEQLTSAQRKLERVRAVVKERDDRILQLTEALRSADVEVPDYRSRKDPMGE